jgi:type I phosphodiesterase/nucleotide pyrophosphatase
MPVVILVADGARPDTLSGSLVRFPTLQRLRDEGALNTVTSVFPSVTGPAYLPFLLGRFPGAVGIPGLRWYDRSRECCGWPDHARSYVGYEMGRINGDLDASAPTLFELVPRSVAAFSVVTRGLPTERRIGALTARSALRAAFTHFRGRAERWIDIDREVAEAVLARVRAERPELVFAALTGIDKASHARGHDSPMVLDALGVVDELAGALREEAERAGWWKDTHLWIVSDHGHAPAHAHDDLAREVARAGYRTVAHPWSAGIAPDVAVMVSGNAMAHLYLEPGRRTRPGWPRLAPRWEPLAGQLLARPSVDLMILADGADRSEVRSARGAAVVTRAGDRYSYRRTTGDPLGVGRDVDGAADETYDATIGSDYPDGIVQIAVLAGASRSGDVILSAAPGHDFRARYEPIPHRSAHGALHRDHMLVPLLTNRAPRIAPRRTTDLFPSALAALRVATPTIMDGRSFL